MLNWKKFLRLVLFAPMLPIIRTTEGGSEGSTGQTDTGGGQTDGTGNTDKNTEGSTGGNDTKPDDDNNKADDKKFTQDEMTRRATAEKQQGRNSVLTELGFDPNDTEAITKAKKLLDEQRTDAEKKDIELKNEKQAKLEAEQKLQEAQRKLAVIAAGANPKYVDEVTALAAAKTDETTDFEKALKAVKDKLPNFFGDDDDSGTGSGQGHPRNKNQKAGELGKRLAETSAKPQAENPYFK